MHRQPFLEGVDENTVEACVCFSRLLSGGPIDVIRYFSNCILLHACIVCLFYIHVN